MYLLTKLKAKDASWLFVLITCVAFLVPAFSVNLSDGMYFSGLALVFVSWFQLFYVKRGAKLDNIERLMIFFWLFYCLFTFVDLHVRTGWIWTEFQEPSRFVLLLPVFLLVRRIGFHEAAMRWGVVIGAIGTGIWGYYQKIHLGIDRVWGGTSGLIAAFGDIGLILGMMSVALMRPLWRKHNSWWVVTIIALGAGAFASLASGTKGGWVSVPLLCWVLVELADKPTYTKRFGVLCGCFFAAILIWWLSPFIQARVSVIIPAIYQYFLHGEVNDFSAGIRLALWHACWLIFIDNPLFGTGPGTFYEQLQHYVSLGLASEHTLTTPGPHSQFFNSIYESGIFGPFMVYGIYMSFMWHCKRYLEMNRSLATAGILLTIGFMDFGLVEVIWDINNAGVFFTVMMVLIAGLLSYQNQQLRHQKRTQAAKAKKEI